MLDLTVNMSIPQSVQPCHGLETSMPDTTYRPSNSELKNPPFDQLHHLHQIVCNGRRVYPQLSSKIEKGFFYSDNKWTCYRRNYISIQCSYTFTPFIPNANLFLDRGRGHQCDQILAMGVSLSAAVDEPNGKPVELIQHTPKRDKGPQYSVQIEKLPPSPPTKPDLLGLAMLSGNHNTSKLRLPLQFDDDEFLTTGSYTTNYQKTFDRIQFKSATANNGKRRAAQQFYHIIVELWADVRKAHESEPTWVKIAQNVSAPMVVRGRSPSHYQNDGPNGNLCNAFDQNCRSGISNDTQHLIGIKQCRIPDDLATIFSNGYLNPGYTNLSAVPSPKGGHFDHVAQPHGIASVSVSSESENSSTGLSAVPVVEKYQYYPNTIFNSEVGDIKLGNGTFDHRVKEELNTNFAANIWQFEGCMQLRTTGTSRGFYPNLSNGS